MKGKWKTTVLSVFLFAGFNLLLFAISPIIDASLRVQLQIMQITLPIIAAVMIIAVEVEKRCLSLAHAKD
jgi:hypothetical protein